MASCAILFPCAYCTTNQVPKKKKKTVDSSGSHPDFCHKPKTQTTNGPPNVFPQQLLIVYCFPPPSVTNGHLQWLFLVRISLKAFQLTVASFCGHSTTSGRIGAVQCHHHTIPFPRVMLHSEGQHFKGILLKQTHGVGVVRRLCYTDRPLQDSASDAISPQWLLSRRITILLVRESIAKCWRSLTYANQAQILYALVACLVLEL